VAKNNDRKKSPQDLRKTRITETSYQNKTAGTSCQHNALARAKRERYDAGSLIISFDSAASDALD
jgi:hypothetical protein